MNELHYNLLTILNYQYYKKKLLPQTKINSERNMTASLSMDQYQNTVQ